MLDRVGMPLTDLIGLVDDLFSVYREKVSCRFSDGLDFSSRHLRSFDGLGEAGEPGEAAEDIGDEEDELGEALPVCVLGFFLGLYL